MNACKHILERLKGNRFSSDHVATESRSLLMSAFCAYGCSYDIRIIGKANYIAISGQLVNKCFNWRRPNNRLLK